MAADLEISLNFLLLLCLPSFILCDYYAKKERSQSTLWAGLGCAHKIAFSITACFHDLMISFP
jgi:hypothetical protein